MPDREPTSEQNKTPTEASRDFLKRWPQVKEWVLFGSSVLTGAGALAAIEFTNARNGPAAFASAVAVMWTSDMAMNARRAIRNERSALQKQVNQLKMPQPKSDEQ